MRLALVLTALVFLPAARAHAADEPLRLETPPKIDALKLVDVDGDGRPDAVTLSSRIVCVWTSGAIALPAATPRWRMDLPADVSFIDVARMGRPALVCLGVANTVRIGLANGEQTVVGESGLGWRDSNRAVFASLHPGPWARPGHVALQPQGWVFRPSEKRQVELDRRLPAAGQVTPPGAFLEDVGTCMQAFPRLVGQADERAMDFPMWAITEWGLTHYSETESPVAPGPRLIPELEAGATDLSFLPSSGDRRLENLGAEAPALIHRDGDNREGRYAFFRQPRPRTLSNGTVVWQVEGVDLRPPAAYLKLAGFNLPPDYVDVDGDGLVDFVVTTMALDGPNIFRAVATGKVTATTLAFLQRKHAPDVAMFPTQPDATVVSEIGVRIRFAHTGTIDVKQSFTILATGDVDGDGRKDLVIRSGPSTLLVRKGTAAGVWAKDATSVAMPPVGRGEECEAYAANLDGQAGDEILLLYRGLESAPDRLYVLKP